MLLVNDTAVSVKPSTLGSYSTCTVASTEFRTHWTFHWHNFIKMRYWRQFRDSLGETSVMITYIMIDYNDNKA
jgi:hypothetical protein